MEKSQIPNLKSIVYCSTSSPQEPMTTHTYVTLSARLNDIVWQAIEGLTPVYFTRELK